MKLYKGEFKSYSIDELSEEARERAYEKWLNTGESGFSQNICNRELEGTLDEFCRIFDVRMGRWEYDSYSYNFSFEITNDTLDDDDIALSGIRLATYVWNNYAKYITKGKYFSLWSKVEKGEHNPNLGKLKRRHSKVMTEMNNCPLTGYVYDCDILDSIIDCLTYKKMFDSYEALINECLNSFFKMCKITCQYHESMEYFIEDAQGNECEYDENGNAFYLPTGFKEVA